MPSTSGAHGGRSASGRGPERAVPFGKYVLLERVSVGGMAEVFRAKAFGAEGFERILAVKRILPTMSEDAEFIEMFIDEARIAGQLTHANIVPLYELGKLGDTHYIAMEFVWGKDLLQVMNRFRRQRKHMPPVMVAWIASKVAAALAYAHEKTDTAGRPLDIVHRDVSPQNVLVSYDGHVKVIDFGIAKAASRNTKTQAGVLKGKFGYMSPEQVRGHSVDARSDLFAVGTCMHEMSTGERLFLGESDFSTLERVRNAEVLPPSRYIADFPPELEAIIMRALSLEVGTRWQSAGELHDALQSFLQTQRPLYGTSKLAAWMKAAFAQEIETEKARAASFQHVSRPTPGPRERRDTLPAISDAAPDSDDTDHDPKNPGLDLEGDKTIVGESHFDSDPPPADMAPGIPEQPTHIFFSAEEMLVDTGEVRDTERPPPALSDPSPHAVRAAHTTIPMSTYTPPHHPLEGPAVLGGFDAASLFPPPAYVPDSRKKKDINAAKVVFFVLLGITLMVGVAVFWFRPKTGAETPISSLEEPALQIAPAPTTPAPIATAPAATPPPTPAPIVAPPTPPTTAPAGAAPSTTSPQTVAAAPPEPTAPTHENPTSTKQPQPAKTPPRARHGELIINTIPWARVYIDGRDTTRNTPVSSLRVRSGVHRVGLRTPDGQLHVETVEIRVGEVTRLIRRF